MLAPGINSSYHSRRILILVCIAWFITKVICYKLWFADRLFPLVPVADILSGLPVFLHSALFFISLTAMLVLLFFPDKKIAVILLLAELFSCSLDQNRWQPWEYQFLFMLAAIIFLKEEKHLLFACRLILAGIYFFSGLSKLNSAFLHDIWQNLILRRWLGIGPVGVWVIRAGYLLPLIEMAAGAALLISRTRKPAALAMIAMHVMILMMLGPLGLNMNAVIWPWNIVMLCLLVLLFYKTTFNLANDFFYRPLAWIILVCWWVLPWLQLGGYWDKYLSSVLYSGGVEQLYICTNSVAAEKQMAVYYEYVSKIVPCSRPLSVFYWGVKEMKTAPYPQRRNFNAIIKAWEKKYPNAGNRYYIYKPGFAYTVREVKVP